MDKLTISSIISGGIITNYYCSSRCGHCLYACSPKWDKLYLSVNTAQLLCEKIKSLGCHSIHIGGGEPFLDIDSLVTICFEIQNAGLAIEYIETNSSWYKNREEAVSILNRLKQRGVSTLLISISPFHNAYIPFGKVKGVIETCQEIGINVFPWISDFITDISHLPETSTHSLDEYSRVFGKDYLKKIPKRYWMHYGGRAISTFKKVLPLKTVNDILKNGNPCTELADTSHFHFDLFGNYIPGLCSGFAIAYTDLGKPLKKEKYPLIHLLYNQGINGFVDYAIKNYGFQPESQYLNKCDLCLEIRSFLVLEKQMHLQELQPKQFYDNITTIA